MSEFNLRDKLAALTAQRDVLEIEADAIASELNSPGLNGQPPAGIKAPLVDSEGYPRGDIDIYNVVNKRKRLAEINTDHKAIMKQIEETLSAIYASSSSIIEDTPTTATVIKASETIVEERPIAKLDEILENSPAFTAGIQENDILFEFGHVKRSTPDYLKCIAKLVGDSVNQAIPLILQRNGERIRIEITPSPWGGRGLLGCHLTPVQ